jgi:succinate dehydrogenase/fumarate reductase flavoprotein subunit
MYPSREMLDLVVIDGKARGIIARNLLTGEIERHSAHAVVLATGGYGTIYFCRLWQLIQMHQQHGKHIKKEPFLQIPALSRYILPVFLS